jgi:hypothetical protein
MRENTANDVFSLAVIFLGITMKLTEIVPWGRTLQEYQQMFALSDRDLQSTILGCGDGPASFNAEMAGLGHSVVSIDPVYQFSATQIEQRVRETYETVMSEVQKNLDRYIWKNFQNPQELGQTRLAAMEGFLADYEAGKAAQRYQTQSLPALNFADRRFDLCLCSHLLFLYSEQLSLDFHLASIIELLRVSKEVRIFPLLALDCRPSVYLEPVLEYLEKSGYQSEVKTVDYEFQKGGNQMLVISNSR